MSDLTMALEGFAQRFDLFLIFINGVGNPFFSGFQGIFRDEVLTNLSHLSANDVMGFDRPFFALKIEHPKRGADRQHQDYKLGKKRYPDLGSHLFPPIKKPPEGGANGIRGGGYQTIA
jgi:hypothetical protein